MGGGTQYYKDMSKREEKESTTKKEKCVCVRERKSYDRKEAFPLFHDNDTETQQYTNLGLKIHAYTMHSSLPTQ